MGKRIEPAASPNHPIRKGSIGGFRRKERESQSHVGKKKKKLKNLRQCRGGGVTDDNWLILVPYRPKKRHAFFGKRNMIVRKRAGCSKKGKEKKKPEKIRGAGFCFIIQRETPMRVRVAVPL